MYYKELTGYLLPTGDCVWIDLFIGRLTLHTIDMQPTHIWNRSKHKNMHTVNNPNCTRNLLCLWVSAT